MPPNPPYPPQWPQPQPPRKKRHILRNVFLGIGGFIVLIIIITAAVNAGKNTSNSTNAASTRSPAPSASPSQTLSAGEQKFVSDARSQLGLQKISDSDLANIGDTICNDRSTTDKNSQDGAIKATESDFNPTMDAGDATTVTRVAESDLCPSELPAETWHTIATFTGSADTNTPQFTISSANSGNWTMKYTYDCSGQDIGKGNFIVGEDGGSDSSGTNSPVDLNNLDGGQTSSTNVYSDAGTHYLQIQTECPYTITVEQKY